MKKNYNKIINQIQKIRSKNNVNWMNVLKLAFRLDPKSSKLNYLGDKNHYNISFKGRAYGVGVNSEGNIFIPDMENKYIYKIDEISEVVTIFDFKEKRLKPISFNEKIFSFTILKKIKKRKKGNFNKIHDIYFDQLDNMYVTDMGLGNDRGQGLVYIFDKELNLIKKLGINAHYKQGLFSPVMTSVNDKYIFVSEWGASKIIIYDKKFNYYGWIGSTDEKEKSVNKKIKSDFLVKNKQILNISLNKVHAIKFDKYKNIYIADTDNNRIIKLSENFDYLGYIGKKESTNKGLLKWETEYSKTISGNNLGEFKSPVGLEINQDFIYIADCFNSRIVKADLKGSTIGVLSLNENKSFYWAKNNDNKINLFHPYAILIQNNKLYIADKGNYKTQIIPLNIIH